MRRYNNWRKGDSTMGIYAFYLTKDDQEEPLSKSEWLILGHKYGKNTNHFFELDRAVAEAAIHDFKIMLKILHGKPVHNDDDSFSIYPAAMSAVSSRHMEIMSDIISKWFKDNARTLYDNLDCLKSIEKSIVLGPNDQNLVYIYYEENMMTLRDFLLLEVKAADDNGGTPTYNRYYISDVRGCREDDIS